MNDKVYNAKELALSTIGININSHSRFCWQNQNHFDLQVSNGAGADAGEVWIGLKKANVDDSDSEQT